jgi:hypothetical protein
MHPCDDTLPLPVNLADWVVFDLTRIYVTTSAFQRSTVHTPRRTCQARQWRSGARWGEHGSAHAGPYADSSVSAAFDDYAAEVAACHAIRRRGGQHHLVVAMVEGYGQHPDAYMARRVQGGYPDLVRDDQRKGAFLRVFGPMPLYDGD